MTPAQVRRLIATQAPQEVSSKMPLPNDPLTGHTKKLNVLMILHTSNVFLRVRTYYMYIYFHAM